MKNKIISIIPIAFFSIPLSPVAKSKKMFGGHIIKVFGVAALIILVLASVAGASPFAYVTNHESNNISVIDIATNKVTANVNVGTRPSGIAVNLDGQKAM